MRSAVLIFTLLVATGPAHAEGPSFNCDFATSQSQIAICGDAVLARQDSDHEALFSQVLAAADRATQARMQQDYALWQQFRDLCGADRMCLARRYTARIGELTAAKNPVVLLRRTAPAAGAAVGRTTGVARIAEAPDLQAIGRALQGGELTLVKPVLTPLEGISVVAALGEDPAPAPPVATVLPDGTIHKPFQDGSIATFNPVTGARGMILPDGRVMNMMMSQVQPDELPVLPPDYDGWSGRVSASLAGLVGNLLTPAEVESLQSKAPQGFFDLLDYELQILAFITS